MIGLNCLPHAWNTNIGSRTLIGNTYLMLMPSYSFCNFENKVLLLQAEQSFQLVKVQKQQVFMKHPFCQPINKDSYMIR